MLPTSLRNAERERVLGQLWKALPEAERAKWKSSAPEPVSSPAPAPNAVLGPAPTFSTDLDTAAPSIPVLAAPVPMLAAPIHARTAPPSVVDARSQTPAVHAPAAPNPSAAHIASASNWLMSMLSEADNDSIMGLMQAKEYFQPTPGGPKAPPQV